MMTLSQEQANTAWVQFYSTFERLGLSQHYDMDKLKTELLSSPCAITEDMGTAYKGALLMHINMVRYYMIFLIVRSLTLICVSVL